MFIGMQNTNVFDFLKYLEVWPEDPIDQFRYVRMRLGAKVISLLNIQEKIMVSEEHNFPEVE